jgi:copper chaperone CopZ
MNKQTLGLMAILVVLMFIAATVLNNVKSETIKVTVDESCKKLLEETAETIDGVIQAEWNDENNELEVVFDGTKTDMEVIESVIAESGFHTSNQTLDEGEQKNIKHKCNPKEKINLRGITEKKDKGKRGIF